MAKRRGLDMECGGPRRIEGTDFGAVASVQEGPRSLQSSESTVHG